jgi:hypothetical protein
VYSSSSRSTGRTGTSTCSDRTTRTNRVRTRRSRNPACTLQRYQLNIDQVESLKIRRTEADAVIVAEVTVLYIVVTLDFVKRSKSEVYAVNPVHWVIVRSCPEVQLVKYGPLIRLSYSLSTRCNTLT